MPLFRTSLAALLFAGAAPAASEPFTLLIYETPAEIALRTDTGDKGKAYWAGYGAFAKQAGDAGAMRGGGVLDPADKVAAVGPAEATPHDATDALKLGGYFLIEAASIEAATEWARKIPAAATGRVEIRAGFPAPQM